MSELLEWRHPESDSIIDRLTDYDQALWYIPEVCIDRIKPFYTLGQLIAWANQDLEEKGCQRWFQNARYPITQFVKICRLYQDFVVHKKNIKPLLLTPQVYGFEPLTGDSRLRAYELVPGRHSVAAVVTGSRRDAIDPISGMQELADRIKVAAGTKFYLRINWHSHPALEWMEIDVTTPIPVTGPEFVQRAQHDICQYVAQQGNQFRFDRDWFCQPHSWSN